MLLGHSYHPCQPTAGIHRVWYGQYQLPGFCRKCQKDTIQFKDLKEIFYKEPVHYHEDFPEESEASCSFCDGYETAIPLNGMWLCLWCLVVQESISKCEWCSQNIMGDASGTFLEGCAHCEGKLGRLRENKND